MIERVSKMRLLQYHGRARAALAAPAQAFGLDRLSRTPVASAAPTQRRSLLGLPAPASPAGDPALAQTRQTVQGLMRALAVMTPAQQERLYDRLQLRDHPDVAALSQALGVAPPRDAASLARLVASLGPAQLDMLIRRFELDKNPDLKRYGGLIRSMPPETVAAMADWIKPKARRGPRPITEADRAFVTGLYRELLNREPDAEGFASHLNGLANGVSREQLRQIFLDSPEYRQPKPAPAPSAAPAPALPPNALGPLPSVPVLPEFGPAPIDRSSVDSALLSAASWVKQTYPQLFTQGDDRALAYKMMTKVIGVLRAHGYDAYRVVNHPSLPPDNPVRYGSDALVLNGNVYDVYRSLGEANEPQVLNHGPMSPNQSKE